MYSANYVQVDKMHLSHSMTQVIETTNDITVYYIHCRKSHIMRYTLGGP